MARKVVGVPIGASFVTTMLTEFGPNGCTLGLGFLSDNTGITLQIVGAVSNTIYIDELLPAVEGISCNINDTSDTTVTITLTGTNVAGQLSLVTGPAASQPVPYAAPIVAADTATPANTAQTGGTAASYSRSDHAHGAILSDTATLASAAQTGGVATDYSRSDHAHGFANPNLLYNSTGEKGPGTTNVIDGWSVGAGIWAAVGLSSNGNVPSYNGAPAVIQDSGNGNVAVSLVSSPIPWNPGTTFTLSGFIAASAVGTLSSSISVELYNGTSWATAGVNGVSLNSTGFCVVTGVAPAGTSQLRVVLYSGEGTSGTDNVFYLLKLESGSFATPWVPSVVAQPWTPYTPVIGGTGWVLGNGTLTGYYHMIDAKTMAVSIELVTGTTTTVGSGDLTLSLPATSAAGNTQEITAKVNYQGSGPNLAVGLGEINPSSSVLTPLAPISINSSITPLSSSATIPANTQIMASGIIQIA